MYVRMPVEKTPEFLKESLKFGINLGLQRMEKLSQLTGDPAKDIKAVHIAGTNGKGSVCAYISSILALSGKKVGIFTSPYLERFSERMRVIDGRSSYERYLEDETEGEISAEDLERLSAVVEKAAEQMTSEGYEHPTEFELVTAICFLWFREQGVDIAVLETGLGGRLDSTNIIEKPLCTVITAMGLDHTDRLGDTIGQIAGEKAGIFKKGCPAVVSDPDMMILDDESKKTVREVFAEKAREAGCDITFVKSGNTSSRYENGKMIFTFGDEKTEYETSLFGDHQIQNAAAAITCARTLGISEDTIAEGISRAVWKGRTELILQDPPVMLDGGHNDQGARSLALTLGKACRKIFVKRKVRLLMGVMGDKDYEGIIRELREGGIKIGELIAVRPENPRSLDPGVLCDEVQNVYNKKVKSLCFDDALEGAQQALGRTLEDGMPLLVTGSLYLIGQVRGKLREMINETIKENGGR